MQQLLSHCGYYDEQLDFIRVERVQVVATIVPGTSAGRSQLSKRLVARLKIAVMSYPDHAQLEAIYVRMLQRVRARWPLHARLVATLRQKADSLRPACPLSCRP